MNFGRTIASLREKWGIDQQDLAKAIGVSKSYVSIVESGHRKPSIKLLTKIAEYFEVPLSYLVFDASSKSENSSTTSKRIKDELGPLISELADFLLSEGKAKKLKRGAKRTDQSKGVS